MPRCPRGSTTVSNEGKENAHLLHLENVLVALRLLGCEFDMDELECMLATLISKVSVPSLPRPGPGAL